jgi:cob(I)alamin adenosyltransferase
MEPPASVTAPGFPRTVPASRRTAPSTSSTARSGSCWRPARGRSSGELCIPGHRAISADQVSRLETELDEFNDALPPLKEFILPGGGPAAAACHVARTIARRAERRVLTLSRAEAVSPEVLKYLNRLSDLLFVLARVLARHERGTEVLWRHDRHRKP